MSKRSLIVCILALACGATTGCGDDGDSGKGNDAGGAAGENACPSKTESALLDDAGEEGAEDGSTGTPEPTTGGDAGGAPTWQRVYDEVIVANTCDSAFCHGGGATGELNLLEGVAYDNLVGVEAAGVECSCSGKKRVAPGKPDESLLVEKLEKSTPSCGTQMPPPSQAAATADQIALVRAWILAGAKK